MKINRNVSIMRNYIRRFNKSIIIDELSILWSEYVMNTKNFIPYLKSSHNHNFFCICVTIFGFMKRCKKTAYLVLSLPSRLFPITMSCFILMVYFIQKGCKEMWWWLHASYLKRILLWNITQNTFWSKLCDTK